MKNSSEPDQIQELESPFIHLTSFQQHPKPAPSEASETSYSNSPFMSVYELEDQETIHDPQNEAFVELMDELYDEEFDDTLEDIANEVQEVYENQLMDHYSSFQQQEAMVQQSLNEHFAPMLNEIERYMDQMANAADQYDGQGMTEEELDGIIEQYVYQTGEAPSFEHLFGWAKKAIKKVKKIAKAAKKVVKKGISIAKKFGLGFIIRKLKGIIIKFLKGFLKKAINRLPRKYRPLAEKLGKRLGVLREATELEMDDDVSYQQQELDGMVTEFLLASNEMEQELIVREIENEANAPIEDPISQLDVSRDQFIQQIASLEEGESAEPALEQFVPAVLTALKLGVRVAGKKRIKGWTVSLLSKLIARYIGKKNARALAQKVVGAGFKLLNLELSQEEAVEEGSRAVAAVVEDTVRKVAGLPDHLLNDETLLQNYVVQAFEESASANLPDILSEEVYKKRPDLREALKHRVAWRMKAFRNGRFKKFRYKKLNKEIETELTPYMANEIKTFGGIPLRNMLRDQMGIDVNTGIPVKVHMYQTLPGANLAHISKYEDNVPGLGNAGRTAWMQLHPLTSVAAGLLMGEPALGCKAMGKCLQHQYGSAGHRYYYLEIPNASPQMYTNPTGLQDLRRTTKLKLKLNFINNTIQLFMFLSESDAQAIALQLRQKLTGSAISLVNMSLQNGLKTAFSPRTAGYVKIVHPKVPPGKLSGMALGYIPLVILGELHYKLRDWVEKSLSPYFHDYAMQFIQATADDADGVTMCITLEAPAGFEVLGQLINRGKVHIPEHVFPTAGPGLQIKTKPGYQYA